MRVSHELYGALGVSEKLLPDRTGDFGCALSYQIPVRRCPTL
jgi:hypothetical protein